MCIKYEANFEVLRIVDFNIRHFCSQSVRYGDLCIQYEANFEVLRIVDFNIRHFCSQSVRYGDRCIKYEANFEVLRIVDFLIFAISVHNQCDMVIGVLSMTLILKSWESWTLIFPISVHNQCDMVIACDTDRLERRRKTKRFRHDVTWDAFSVTLATFRRFPTREMCSPLHSLHSGGFRHVRCVLRYTRYIPEVSVSRRFGDAIRTTCKRFAKKWST